MGRTLRLGMTIPALFVAGTSSTATTGCLREKPSPRRVPLGTVEKVLGLYQEKYFDFNVRHFHEKLREEARPPAELHLGEAGIARGRG